VVCNRFVGRGNFQGFVEVWFSDFYVIGGQGCPQILVDLYWLGGLVFPSEFLKLTRLQNINFVSHVYLMIHL
jgi:hypothetical protein